MPGTGEGGENAGANAPGSNGGNIGGTSGGSSGSSSGVGHGSGNHHGPVSNQGFPSGMPGTNPVSGPLADAINDAFGGITGDQFGNGLSAFAAFTQNPLIGLMALATKAIGDTTLSGVTADSPGGVSNTGANGGIMQNIQSLITPTGNPTTDAANLQAGAIADGNALLQQILQQAMGVVSEGSAANHDLLSPFLNAGTSALGNVAEGQTIDGLDQRLAQIMGSGSFESLRDERGRAVNSHLAANGLRRSGTGIEAAANIPTDLAFEIENMLNGRSTNLANTGFTAGTSLADNNTNAINKIAGLLTQGGISGQNAIIGSSEAIASGILGNQSIDTANDAADDARDLAYLQLIASLFSS